MDFVKIITILVILITQLITIQNSLLIFLHILSVLMDLVKTITILVKGTCHNTDHNNSSHHLALTRPTPPLPSPQVNVLARMGNQKQNP